MKYIYYTVPVLTMVVLVDELDWGERSVISAATSFIANFSSSFQSYPVTPRGLCKDPSLRRDKNLFPNESFPE